MTALQAQAGVSLPELPEAHGVFMIHDFNAKPADPIRYRDVFTAEQMRAYALASLAAERAEAVRVREDADRYRLLRDGPGEWDMFKDSWLSKMNIYGGGPDDLDAAIDSLKKGGKP